MQCCPSGDMQLYVGLAGHGQVPICSPGSDGVSCRLDVSCALPLAMLLRKSLVGRRLPLSCPWLASLPSLQHCTENCLDKSWHRCSGHSFGDVLPGHKFAKLNQRL